MRPARTILIMQLSNSREARFAFFTFFLGKSLAKLRIYGKIPSLTVEKKNECHNP